MKQANQLSGISNGRSRNVIRTTASIVIAIAILSLTLVSNKSAQAFTGTGTGTKLDPYIITTCDDLQSIDTDAQNDATYNAYYELAGDISCAATSGWNGGLGFDPIDNFYGKFDGKGHTISGLTINRPDADRVGLFYNVNNQGVIARLNLTDISISGRNYVGGLAGELDGTTLDVHVSGEVTGVSDQYYYGTGGIAGRKGGSDGTITRTSFTGTVTSSGVSTGGLFGFAGNVGLIDSSYADATVNGQAYTGGLIGYLSACCNVITNSYATGQVNGSVAVGGFIGIYYAASSDNNRIENVFAAAEVNADSTYGAMFGQLDQLNSTPITNVSFDQTVAGTANCVGSDDASAVLSCTARNTDGLSADYFFESTNQPLASWDFEEIWTEQASDYPGLQTVSELTLPGVVSDITITHPTNPDQATVAFDTPAAPGSFPIYRYDLQVKLAADGWDAIIDTDSGNTGPLQAYDLRLETNYTARVRALSVYGASEWVEQSFTTQAAANHDIATCEELEAIDQTASYLDNITLTQNIDCAGIENFQPLDWEAGYRGIFDGQNHTISNLVVDTDNHAGLFYYGDRAVFKNVTFDSGSIRAEYGYAGAMVAETDDSDFSNIHSNIDVEATLDGYAGGIAGFVEGTDQGISTVLENLSSSGNISGSDDVGGLFGELENDEGRRMTLRKSFATGNVSSTTEEEGYTNYGGLIGDVEAYNDDDDQIIDLIIEDSYASGNVSGPGSTGGLIGDLAVFDDGYDNAPTTVIVRRTYATGNVEAIYSHAGGLIGDLESLDEDEEFITIQNNFSASSVMAGDGYERGGIAGYYSDEDYAITSENNVFDSSTVADCSDSNGSVLPGCTGIDETSQPNYFKNNTSNAPLDSWDFEDIWQAQATDYPKLADNVEPAGEDLNGDNVPDSQQPRLSGYVSPLTGKIVVIDTGADCEITTDDTTRESNLTVQDAGYDYTNGLFDFEADCESSSTTIKLYYYGVSINDLVVRKFNPNTNAYFTIPGASLSQQTINGQSVAVATYEIVDGGELDMDGEVNGAIKDPAGVGTLAVGAPNTGIGGRR